MSGILLPVHSVQTLKLISLSHMCYMPNSYNPRFNYCNTGAWGVQFTKQAILVTCNNNFMSSAVSHRIFCSPNGAIRESLSMFVEGFLHTFGRVQSDGWIELLVHKIRRCPSAKRHLVRPAYITYSSFTDPWSTVGKLVQYVHLQAQLQTLPGIFSLA
jgi:hypothetical protein